MMRLKGHPNIVSVKHDNLIRTRNSLYIIMEYCNQGSLTDLVTKLKNKDPPKLISEETATIYLC